MSSKCCPDCGVRVEVRANPAGNPLLSLYECTNSGCDAGSIYVVNVHSAMYKADATPVLIAMRDLAASIEGDAEAMQEMLDFLRNVGRGS